MPKINFSKEQEEQIIFLYNQNYSQKQIGDTIGCSRSAIKRVLQNNDIVLRRTTNKYKADYRTFQKIDSEEKAYWLGFIAADGCVYKRDTNASLIISLSITDKSHLEKFRDFMKADVDIKEFIQKDGFSNNTKMCKIVFNSIDLVQDLIDKNIVPKKSLILQKPNIDSKFYIHFIRGYFDGDGSIYQLKNGSFGISIQGTKEILKWINEVLEFDATKLEKRYNDNKNNYYIRCGGNLKTLRIANQLYKNANIYLERKFEKYESLLKSRL